MVILAGELIMNIAIRLIITGLLICGAYTETGIWTAICLGLIFASIELMGATEKIRQRNEKEGVDSIEKYLRGKSVEDILNGE
jgi:hypothetical protein